MTEHASAWSSLIEEWVARENKLQPHAPIDTSTVRVRDNVEIGDQMFILVSYDVEYPWPDDEDTEADGRHANTAVLQAQRVRTPWIEQDATRSHSVLSSDGGETMVFEHVLGRKRAFSGHAATEISSVTLHFADGSDESVSVVGGWFLAVVAEDKHLKRVSGGAGAEAFDHALEAGEPDWMVASGFGRAADRTMYFSPLDLRSVRPIQHWERAGDIVVVATSVEQYDEGGLLRLRIDGIRSDDDVLVSWPKVRLSVDGSPVASGVCGEYSLGDTLSLDIGFRPWISDTSTLSISVEGLRGADGPVGTISFDVSLTKSR